MPAPRLLDSLPELVREGLISAEQAERIALRYRTAPGQSSNRMMLLFSLLGGLLIGLGIILVVAHNWNDLPRGVRTFFALLPMAIGQGIVLYALIRKPGERGWAEGGSAFLFMAVGACLAMISQIYHHGGTLQDLLLIWSVLVLALLYVPGSLFAGMLYLGVITWYAGLLRMELWSGHSYPFLYWPLLVAALPMVLREWKERGNSVGFHWLAIGLALSIGFASQLFWDHDHMEIALAIAGLATAYLLVPTLHIGQPKRTGPFTSLGGLAMLCVLFFFSYHDAWDLRSGRNFGSDIFPLVLMVATGVLAYAFSLLVRKPFTGSMFPESFGAVLLCYAGGWLAPELAAALANLWLLVLGVHTVRAGLQFDSLPRMNLGLGIISLIVLLRFFDLHINVAIKGLVFIALGVGFLVMNLRLMRKRKQQQHA